MNENINSLDKKTGKNMNNTLDPDIIKNNNIMKAQKTKYFINKQYQRFISIIYFLIGCYFLYYLFCFLISIYVSIEHY